MIRCFRRSKRGTEITMLDKLADLQDQTDRAALSISDSSKCIIRASNLRGLRKSRSELLTRGPWLIIVMTFLSSRNPTPRGAKSKISAQISQLPQSKTTVLVFAAKSWGPIIIRACRKYPHPNSKVAPKLFKRDSLRPICSRPPCRHPEETNRNSSRIPWESMKHMSGTHQSKATRNP